MSDQNAGPLSSIEDDAARREIRKLWGRFDGMDDFATKADIANLRKLIADQSTAASSLGVVVSGGPGGSSLLTSNNQWTGSQLWGKRTVADAESPLRAYSLNAGPLASATSAIMLEEHYGALLDVRKTTDGTECPTDSIGGVNAIFVQHRITNVAAPGAAGYAGVRVHLETEQFNGWGLNIASGIYVDVFNRSSGGSVFGARIGTTHAAGDHTYGVLVDAYRTASAGHTAGFAVRAASGTMSYGFVAYGGSASVLFAGGSAIHGAIRCDIGLDLGLASCSAAAIVIPSGSPVMWNGPAGNMTTVIQRYASGAIEFLTGGSWTLRIVDQGYLQVPLGIAMGSPGTRGTVQVLDDGTTMLTAGGCSISINGGGEFGLSGVSVTGSTEAGKPSWIRVAVNGSIGYIPLYSSQA